MLIGLEEWLSNTSMMDIPGLWQQNKSFPQAFQQFSLAHAVPLVQKQEDVSSTCPC